MAMTEKGKAERDKEMLGILLSSVICARIAFSDFAYGNERMEYLYKDTKYEDDSVDEIRKGFDALETILNRHLRR